MKQCNISVLLNWDDAETNASFDLGFDPDEGQLIVVDASHRIMISLLDLGAFIPVTKGMSDTESEDHVRRALLPVTVGSQSGSLARGAHCTLQIEIDGELRMVYEGTISALKIALPED